MRLHRPVLAGLALFTVLPVTAASAATGVAAAGSAMSTATLATVSVGNLTIGATTIQGHSVSIGTVTAGAQTLSPSVAPSVTFVPLTVDGTQTGAYTVTPANSPVTLGGISTAALPMNVLSATSPSATLTAATTSASRTSGLTAKLGSAQVLGLPVVLNGGVNVGSVTDASHAQAGKTLTISNVGLPNLADLIAALGIDIAKLPVDTLNGLVQGLPLAINSATATAIDNANDAIDTADAQLTAAETALANGTAAYNTAEAALDAALAGADYTGITLPSGMAAPLDHTDWDALTAMGAPGAAVQTLIGTANSSVGLTSVPTSTAAVYQAAKDALPALQAAVTTLTGALAGVIATLSGIVEGLLAGTPLVSVGAGEVGIKAYVGTTKTAAVTGYVSGVKVMGEDVLQVVTGNTKLDAAKLVGDLADEVNAEIADITGSLSAILSGATGATGLSVPAPSIQVLTKTTSTGVDGAFGLANATVTALSVSLGSATIPQAYALSDAAGMAGIGETATGFKTAPLSVKVGVLAEAARFRPAGSTTPGNSGQMPSTGAPAGLAIVAVIGVAVAVVTRRRLRSDNS
jgi:hypothetical protein